MSKPQNLDYYIENSGYKISYIVSKLGISRSAFDKKRKGQISFKVSELNILCELLGIPDEMIRPVFFLPIV